MNDWPKHPDGSNKSIGEMTEQERILVFKDCIEQMIPEFAAVGIHIIPSKKPYVPEVANIFGQN